MMGHQHALGGATAWLGVAAATSAGTATQVALGAVLAVGGGMLPDLDQHGSTIGRTYGPITNVLARLVGALAGGHRNGTHSVLGVALFGAAAYGAAAAGGWVLFGALWLLFGVADNGLDKGPRWWRNRGWAAHAVVMAVVTWCVLATGADVTVPLVAGATIGAASHVALDMLTPERCPLWWPLSKRRHGVGLVTTGSPWSSPIVTGVLTVSTAGLALYVGVTI